MISPSFTAVSGGLVKVADIKVEGAGGYGDVYMQSMGSSGSFDDVQYFYLTMDGWGVEDGWYRDNGGADPVDDSDIVSVGQSVSLHSDGDITITFKKVID